MKAAIITEEQIKAIEDALDVSTTHFNKDRQAVLNALAIVKSLKVQEPVAMVCDAYNCEGLEWLCDAPPRRLSMLFVGEKA